MQGKRPNAQTLTTHHNKVEIHKILRNRSYTPLNPLWITPTGSSRQLPIPTPSSSILPQQRATRDLVAATAPVASKSATEEVEAALSDPDFRTHWSQLVRT